MNTRTILPYRQQPDPEPREPLPSGFHYGYIDDTRPETIVGPFIAAETARKRVESNPERTLMRCPTRLSYKLRKNWEEVPE
jgi:hypothetical protein